MELELNLTHLNCYDTILDDTISQEETLEAIVPDACPDIARIVDTEGTILLTGKEVKEGRAEISGVVKATVVYLPDGRKGLCRMEVNLPFRMTLERSGLKPPCKLIVCPRLRMADAKLLNPRKILTRMDLAAAVKIFAPKTAAICEGANDAGEQGIQQQKVVQDTYLTTSVQEKPFTFTDDVHISGSKPGAEELLKSRAEILCNESKIIGNKLIFKGEVTLQVLYRTGEDALASADFILPFSQIMEVAGVQEEADSAVNVLMTDLKCNLTGEGEGRTIAVSMNLLGQAVVREHRRVELLADVYSTAYEHTFEIQPYDFKQLEARGTNRISMREQMETELPVRAVNDVNIHMGHLAQTRSGNSVRLSAEVMVRVVYTAEDGSVRSAVRRMPAECDLDVSPESVCSFQCSPAGERLAAPGPDGLEVRFLLDFEYLVLSSQRVNVVSKVKLDENRMRNHAKQPSVILRMVDQQESLWDIAKSYATTTVDIMQANGLVEEVSPSGRLLLIPKKR